MFSRLQNITDFPTAWQVSRTWLNVHFRMNLCFELSALSSVLFWPQWASKKLLKFTECYLLAGGRGGEAKMNSDVSLWGWDVWTCVWWYISLVAAHLCCLLDEVHHQLTTQMYEYSSLPFTGTKVGGKLKCSCFLSFLLTIHEHSGFLPLTTASPGAHTGASDF